MPATDQQADVFAFLERATTHAGEMVRRIDTHAAAVFLAGERAYKIKRAVRFPFLDYSSLEKRKAACEAELEVNKPFAPAIYLGVVPITRDGAALAIDGDGEPVEWAVLMRRFDENATLDHLADRGAFDATLADRLARVVASAHANAPVVAAEPWFDALSRFIEQNDEAFRQNAATFDAGAAAELTRRTRAAFVRQRDLLVARGKAGLVRQGHGDLHLGNIAMIDGAPVPFDAIEFDPLVAAGDVFYDLAFLLMDLVDRGLPEAANVVFNRYLLGTRRADDLDALAALPLFLSLRAAIRAKVTAARLETAKRGDREKIANAARAYFRLACDLIAPPAPKLVAIGGLSGTGKSTIARGLAPHLAPAPGAVLVRSDVERKMLAGVGETERLPVDAYTKASSRDVYAAIIDKALRVTAAGHSAIVDAVFADPSERADIQAAAAQHGVHLTGIFLTADLATRVARVGQRAADASDADAQVARQQEAYDVGALEWTEVDASASAEETLKRVRTALGV